MSSWKSGASVEVLRERSTLLQKIRQYFAEQNILEVDTPSISKFPTIDENIEPIEVYLKDSKIASYLITSPEYHMKRLLCFGMPSIYQICKAFRKDEAGCIHNPEFTIIEWYQLNIDDQQLMKSVDGFLQFTINAPPATFISYKEVFEKYLNVNPFDFTQDQFIACCQKMNLTPPKSLLEDEINIDDQLNFLMGY